MKKIAVVALILFISISHAVAHSTERLFYLTPNVADFFFSQEQLQHIKDHAHSIDIIAPQIYELDKHGIIWGTIDTRLLTLAKEKHLKIMPLIVNTDFNQEQFHTFLHNPLAEKRAISGMLSLCKKYHFYGLQFDFEHIHIDDKNQLTRFFQAAANRLHQHGFAISIAVVPRTSTIFYSDYDRWYFENWSGAYDYKALGHSGDFISVMSYDQHTSLTTPGPIAARDWVEKTIQSLLKVVPAKKISLGIPDYSGLWSSGKLDLAFEPPQDAVRILKCNGYIPEQYTYRSKEITMGYPTVLSLLKQYKQSVVWQNQWKSSYVIYSNHDKNEYLFIEDAQSFRAKVALAKHYQLRGISVWKLGLEDPAIWN